MATPVMIAAVIRAPGDYNKTTALAHADANPAVQIRVVEHIPGDCINRR